MGRKTYGHGIVMGILSTLLVLLMVMFTVLYFNVGNLGNLMQTLKILNSYSLKELPLSEKCEGMSAGLLESLDDPYSYYLNEADYKEMQEDITGSYTGLGIYLTTMADADYTEIMAPIKGSPAFDAGFEAGDEIVSINGEDMMGVSADKIANQIKHGKENHFVIVVRRDNELLTFELDRAEIDIPSVDGKFLEGEDGIAYIAISQFTDKTPGELTETITDLENTGEMKGIVLDLRNNPGGSVSAVIQVADTFLTQGETILWVEEKKEETKYDAQNANPCSYPLVVLVNENSASASEILTGAIKDNKRGKVVGVTTFGKGIIQTVYEVYDGCGVKITTAEYLSPDRNKIHEIGIEPNIKVELKDDDYSVIYTLDSNLDPQLAKALETLKAEIK